MALSPGIWKGFDTRNEEDIWQQLKGGNHLALEYFYRTYSKSLYNFGMKLYGQQQWIEDCLQELFIDLWKQHERLAEVSSIKTYLFRAFKYKLQRQRGRENRWVHNLNYETLPEMEVELPLESVMISAQLSKEQKLKIAKSMEKLSARQKEVLHLLFQVGASYEEVAEIMEINVRSVYTLAWKGISALRKLVVDFIFLLASAYFLLTQL